MARDHAAVNDQALALVKKLGVTPQDNPTSQSLSKNAADQLKKLAALKAAHSTRPTPTTKSPITRRSTAR